MMKQAGILPILMILAFILGCVDGAAVDEDFEVGSHVEDWRDEIIYQVMVDRFANGDRSNDFNVDPVSEAAYHGGDWQGLIDRLDYFEELGVTALWISPVVKNVEEDAGFASYHGYWAQDFTSVNPHFGDLAKLREFVNACHARNPPIKVILDVVVNHIGQLFYYDINRNGQPDEWLTGSATSSPLSRATEWDPDFDSRGVQAFTSMGESGSAPIRWVYMPEISRTPPMPEEFQNPDWYNRMGRVTVWGREKDACLTEGVITREEADNAGSWRDLPACEAYVTLQETRGDFPGGLKDLDTTLPEVRQALFKVFADWIEKADFDGFRIDTVKHVEHEFFQYFCPQIRQFAHSLGKENFFMFGEVFDGYDPLLGSYTHDDELDSLFYFSQKFAIDGVFKYNGPTSGLEDLYQQRLANYSRTSKPNGPVGADGASLVPTQLLVNFLDNHDLPRFLYDFEDIDALHAALFYQFTIDGLPCLYYGTEQEFDGGNDPANREDMWKSGYATDGPTFRHVQKLTALRRDYAPLRRGDFTIRWSTDHVADEQDAGIYAFEREYKGERILVVINAHGSHAARTSATDTGGGEMTVGFPAGTRLVNVFEDADPNDEAVVSGNQTVNIVVPARGGKVFVAR